MKNYLSENNTKIIGVLESKYDTDISSELTSQMNELVEYMSQLDLLNIDYKLIANNTIIKENIGYAEKNIISDEFEMGTLLVETCLILQDGVGNQIEKVYQKFEVEPETEEVTVEE